MFKKRHGNENFKIDINTIKHMPTLTITTRQQTNNTQLNYNKNKKKQSFYMMVC